MTQTLSPNPAPQLEKPKPDRTILLVLFFILTSAVLLGSHDSRIVEALGPLGSFLKNPIIEAFFVSLFLANILFTYLWKAAPWAKVLVAVGSLIFVLPWAGRADTSLLDLSIQIMIFAALALGLNIVVGLAGLLDLGYVAFFAVGAYLWGVFASPRLSEILTYFGENPGATNGGTLAMGLVLTVATGATIWYVNKLHSTNPPTKVSVWSLTFASFGLVAGLVLVSRAIMVLASGQAGSLENGIDPNYFWLFLALSIFAAAIVGILIGLPVLRLKGDYLAIITLGLGEVIRVLANNLELYTAGPQGIDAIEHVKVSWFDNLAKSLGFSGDQFYLLFLYFLVLVIIALILLANIRLDQSRIGRAWIAIRDDEVAAQAMGVPLVQTKLIAFATGASFAGVMGMIFAAKQTYVSPESFILLRSIEVLSMVILGGMGSFSGVILGAAVVTLLNLRILPSMGEVTANLSWIPSEANPAKLQRLVFGAILVAMMLLRPEGLLPVRRRAMELHKDDPANEGPAIGEEDLSDDAKADSAEKDQKDDLAGGKK